MSAGTTPDLTVQWRTFAGIGVFMAVIAASTGSRATTTRAL